MNHTHLPAWLERNFIFRKLFLLRKLFLSRRKFSHYGQNAEDVAIARFFSKRYKGFFVDVGCFHPMKYNNTYRLYKKGWRGINLDIDSIKIEGFNLIRPGDTNLARAVSNQSGELTYWTNGFYSPTVTLDRAFAESEKRNKKDYRPKTVKAERLTQIIDATKHKNQAIDLLSVDVEGHDHQVLQSLDFERYSPRLIVVETQLETLEEVMREATYLLLKEHNYDLVNWVGMTLMFRKRP